MAVAYSLVAEMDATMRVEEVGASEANVRIELPLIDYLPQLPATSGHKSRPSTQTADVSGLEVAVVDNEPGIRSVGQGMLKHLGHLVTCFASGEELLRRVAAGACFDLILLDNAMPGLSGRSTYVQLRPLTNARVLISSGRPVELQNYAPAEVPPPDGLLEKPFSLATLATVIAGLI
jgi:CheY-like chemotaxis protein